MNARPIVFICGRGTSRNRSQSRTAGESHSTPLPKIPATKASLDADMVFGSPGSLSSQNRSNPPTGRPSMRILRSIRSVNPEHGGPIEGINQVSRVHQEAGHTVQIVSLDSPDDPWVANSPL